MHLKAIAFLCVMFLSAQANARILRVGLDSSREGDIQSITITEYAPHGRTVTLTKPDELKASLHQFEDWDISVPKHWKRDFYNMFPVRYSVTVQRGTSTYTLLLAVQSYQQQRSPEQAWEPCIRFVLFSPEPDGSFITYLEGAGRSLNAPDTPFEQYLAQLFPPA